MWLSSCQQRPSALAGDTAAGRAAEGYRVGAADDEGVVFKAKQGLVKLENPLMLI